MKTIELLAAAGERPCDNQHPYGLTELRAALIQKQPAFASLLFTIGKLVFVEGNVIETAATDGEHIFVSIKYWDSLNMSQAMFLIAHEIVHMIMEHPSRTRAMSNTMVFGQPFDESLYNDAADYVINDHLTLAKCGSMPEGGLHDTSIGKAADTVEHVYKGLLKDKPKGKPDDKQGEGPGNGPGTGKPNSKGTEHGLPAGGQFDRILRASEDSHDPTKIKQAVSTAMSTAKAQGKAPASLLRLFEDVLDPKVDWRFLLKLAFHSARGRNRSTWRRLNRRFLPQGLLMPGRDGSTLGTVVVGFDTSGSVSPNEAQMYLGEMTEILQEIRPKELWVIPCDARVYRPVKLKTVEELKNAYRKGFGGGGGTDFRPVFDWVIDKSIRPEVLVFCTDMYGTFPRFTPPYPVIWVSTGGTSAPFGKVIKIDE